MSYPPFLIPRQANKNQRVLHQTIPPIKIVKGKVAANVLTTNSPDIKGIHSHNSQNFEQIPNQKTDNPSLMMLWEDSDSHVGTVGQNQEHGMKVNTVRDKQVSISSTKNINSFTVSDVLPDTLKTKVMVSSSMTMRSTIPSFLTTRFGYSSRPPLPHEFYSLKPTPSASIIQSFRNIFRNMTSYFQPQPSYPKPPSRPTRSALWDQKLPTQIDIMDENIPSVLEIPTQATHEGKGFTFGM